MMYLAIIGSRKARMDDAEPIIRSEIALWTPTAVVSGGAEGVDLYAEFIARELGLPVISVRPATGDWVGYQARNRIIVDLCHRLVCISSKRSKTYGAGWTRDLAVKCGKDTKSYDVP